MAPFVCRPRFAPPPAAARGRGPRRIVAALLLLLPPSIARGEEQLVIPGGREADIVALAAPIVLGAEVTAGYRLDGIRVEGQTFAFVLGGEGRQPVELRFAPDPGAASHRFEVVPPEPALDAAALQAVRRLRETVAPRIDAALWERLLVSASGTRSSPVRSSPPLLPWIVTVVAFVALALLQWRAGAPTALSAAALPLALAPIVAWYLLWGGPPPALDVGQLESWLQERERSLVQLALAVALAALAAASLVALRSTSGRGRYSRPWLDVGVVLGWSLFVRFVLTTANVLTDGGSGWSRLLDYRRGFSGLAVLVDLVLPDRSMWESIFVPRFLAALSPPILLLLARALRVDRAAAFFAGLALASLPLHAALYSSDFESGAIVTLMLAALAIVAAAVREDSAVPLAAGLALFGYALWGRPESIVVGLPLLVAVWPASRRLWPRGAVVGAVVWLAGLTFVRVMSLQQLVHGSRNDFAGPWSVLPLGEFLTTSAVMPLWLWLPAPIGLVRLGGRARVAALAGLVAGLVPEHTAPTMFDRTETYLEFFRYGSFALPWLVLLAGAGLAACADWMARRWPRLDSRVPAAALALLLVATPLANRGYLARRYGPALDEEAFRAVLARVPWQCRLIVPDDDDRRGRGSLEVMKRYAEITREVSGDGTQPRLIGLSVFLREWNAGARRDDECWFFYSGTYCHDGFEGDPPSACSEVLERAPFERVWSRDVEYRSHRLISRPKRAVAPWYEPRLTLSLYRLGTPGAKGE